MHYASARGPPQDLENAILVIKTVPYIQKMERHGRRYGEPSRNRQKLLLTRASTAP
jgi:hypothetical protein